VKGNVGNAANPTVTEKSEALAIWWKLNSNRRGKMANSLPRALRTQAKAINEKITYTTEQVVDLDRWQPQPF